jgi:hypothetical protein
MMFSIDHGGLNNFVFPLFNRPTPPKPLPRVTKIKFAPSCNVILIPCRQEYIDAKIDLWYKNQDRDAAEKVRTEEVTTLLRDHPNASIQTAMTYLYQPRYQQVVTCKPKPMNVLIVSSDSHKVAESLQTVLCGYNQWEVILHRAATTMSAKDILMASKSINVVMLSSQIVLGCNEDSLLLLMNCLRQQHGSKVIVGIIDKPMLVSDSSDSLYDGMTSGSEDSMSPVWSEDASREDIKLRQVIHDYNMDFIWKEPIDEIAHMLPLLLDQQGKKGQDRKVFRTTSSPPPEHNNKTKKSFTFSN